jgi:hypothetical protein
LAWLDAFNQALVAANTSKNKRQRSKDAPTQWNATYLMIESSLPCKLALKHLTMEDTKFVFCPSKSEWDELVAMKNFLEPFYKGMSSFF